MSEALIGVIAQVYGAPPEDFVAARAAAVAQARKDGDRNLAASIAKLRKPTVAAWLVNLLAHQRPDRIADLLALGAELGRAQRGLAGTELRELSTRRRQLVAELTRESRALAVAAGRGARDPLPLAEVEATLTAALADAAVGADVQAGRLTRAAEYAGFGELPRPQLRLVQGSERAPAAPEDTSPPEAEPDVADPDLSKPDPAGERTAAPRSAAGRRAAERAKAERPEAEQTQAERTRAEQTQAEQATAEQTQAQAERARAEHAQAEQAQAEHAQAEQAQAERAQAEQAQAEHAQAERARAEHAQAERAEALRRRTSRAAAHRELLAARTELAEAEAARTVAERAVLAARRRVEAALARATGLDGDQIQG